MALSTTDLLKLADLKDLLVEGKRNETLSGLYALAALKDEMGMMEADLHRFTEHASKANVREKTVASKLTEYSRLKEKAEVYADLLDIEAQGIVSRLGKLRGAAIHLMEAAASREVSEAE